MRTHFAIAFMLALITPTIAEELPCESAWKVADADGNGVLDKPEDKEGYFARLGPASSELANPDRIARDEFLKLCTDKRLLVKSTPSQHAGTKDRGKGDITPGSSPISREDAQAKLEASGYKDVRELQLDPSGVWKGRAVANGKTVMVSVDQQGDIVSN